MAKALSNTTLAVLAGGEGARMGQAKALVTIRGRPILEHILHLAQWPGPTLVVTAPGRQNPPGAACFDLEAIDPVPGQGPLRGILTALEFSLTEELIVLPLDMPAMDREPLGWLSVTLQDQPATVVGILLERLNQGQAVLEPLPAGFRRSAKPLLTARLASGSASLRGLRDAPEIRVIRTPPTWPWWYWTNLNTPGDVSDFEKRPEEAQ